MTTNEFSTVPATLPDHTQLPESDGTFVKNFQEHPQSILLTDSITPLLQQLHPDAQYCIGQDCGVYWRLTEPPEKGAEAPDWFYVPNVPPTLDGQLRRSYVLWQEIVAPLIELEFVSGDGQEERDQTSYKGKFWVYEQAIRVPFYKAFSTGTPVLLPDLPIQYADFAVWQRQWLQGEELETHLAYWRQQLGGTLPVLELPTDRPRLAVRTFQGATQSFLLSSSLSEALKTLSQRVGVTLFMTLLTAFNVLLYRYTGQEDIIVG